MIKSKKIFGELLGRNVSKFKGVGLEFRELREYQYSEDAKKIDWKISAKLNKPYVKEFDEERELNIIIAIMVSGSLHFGSKKLKSEFIAEIVEILGYAATKNEDKVRLIFIDNPPLHLKPTKSKKLIPYFSKQILNYSYLKKDYVLDLEFLNRLKKGILILIGDFYKIPNLRLKHEVYAIIVRDKFEENPIELINAIDPITFKEKSINPNQIKEFVKNTDKDIELTLKKEKIPFTKIYTDENPIYKLIRLFR